MKQISPTRLTICRYLLMENLILLVKKIIFFSITTLGKSNILFSLLDHTKKMPEKTKYDS